MDLHTYIMYVVAGQQLLNQPNGIDGGRSNMEATQSEILSELFF